MGVYIGNLSYDTTEADLNDVFEEYGTVKRVTLPSDRETGRVRGFAFVDLGSDAEEQAAIEALDGAEWMGRDLRVNKAKLREPRPTATKSPNLGSDAEEQAAIEALDGAEWMGRDLRVNKAKPREPRPTASRSPDLNANDSEPGISRKQPFSIGWLSSLFSGWAGLEVPYLGRSSATQSKSSQNECSTNSDFSIVLKGDIDDLSAQELESFIDHLKQISGDESIEIVDIRSGSIILKLTGTEEGFKIIEELWRTGKLKELVGLPIECVELENGDVDQSEDLAVHTKTLSDSDVKKDASVESRVTYVFNNSTVHQNNQTSMATANNEFNHSPIKTSRKYTNNLPRANVKNLANSMHDEASQSACVHSSTETLKESRKKIEDIAKRSRQVNPAVGERELIKHINEGTTPGFKNRLIEALQHDGESSFEEFIRNACSL